MYMTLCVQWNFDYLDLNYPALHKAFLMIFIATMVYVISTAGLHRDIVLHLSGLFAYPDGFQHKGVRITKGLLYYV